MTDRETKDNTEHRPVLADRLAEPGALAGDEILDQFLAWVEEIGFELYPAQEEALLEVIASRHVILNTPTGSGKSLVALGLHYKALCEGKISYYTSPIKALASEKFFDLCDEFGAQRVGMLTGDAAINPQAPIICCTAEVLANQVMRMARPDVPYVVMDEFHYYSDADRGVAWQVPLIGLRDTQFLLMSATLGDVSRIATRLEEQTARKVAWVHSAERPVPLDYEYRETPLHQTLADLLGQGKFPIYLVNFTQRECVELAQSFTSMQIADRDHRRKIREAIGDFRFDTPFGKELRRYLGFGIGVHHAGLLPKYRLLVEQLAQQGLLRVICGTDTLGVGVNIPIRTVLFTKLAKFDGTKTGILSVRDFQQIAGRAGRRGFDEQGSVVCQAPERTIERRKREQRGGRKVRRRKTAKRRKPGRDEITWDRKTFESLVRRPPETLKSQFQVNHGMVLNLLQRDSEANDPDRDNFSSLRELIGRSHETPGVQRRLLSRAAELVRSLYRVGLVEMERDRETSYLWVTVNEELQREFSMHQPLSLYLVETLERLQPESEGYALNVLTLVEAILENPKVILYKQQDRARTDLLARLRAEGVPYEERREKLEEVTWPKPNAEFLYATFDDFRAEHPWILAETVRPKDIGRQIYENYWTFNDFVKHYGLQRSEGVLLRYLSQLYKTLLQNVPETVKDAEIYDIEGFLRTLLERTDTSLLEEWESMLHPDLRSRREADREAARLALRNWELFHDPRAFAARVRAELHQVVRALARRDWERAAASVRQPPNDPWPPERFEEVLAPFHETYGEVLFNGEARLAQHTQIRETAPRVWEVTQVLLDSDGDNLWHLAGKIDLTGGQPPEGPLVSLRYVGE